jgi:hypothetical protein
VSTFLATGIPRNEVIGTLGPTFELNFHGDRDRGRLPDSMKRLISEVKPQAA